MRTYHIAWWNLENLFDEENAVALGRRTDKVFRAIKDDITGWTPQLRDRKIDQLASVIAAMNTGLGPDLIGVCEVENRFVVERLVDRVNGTLSTPRNYTVVHADTNDARGIDVAFIYDDSLFQVPLPLKESVFFHVVMRRHATREIVQVNFTTTTAAARTWAVFGNHWPSRSGGQFESEGYRAIAGETLSYFHQRVLEVHGRQTPVLAMGDFNDEPFDTSLVRHALSTRQRAKVTSAREEPLLWNLMWPIAGAPDGSFYFDNQPNMLDQFLVNKNMATADASIKIDPATVQIFKLPAMINSGVYPKPIPFGGMGKPVNQNGFSDHFPITLTVTEVD
ncbi:MAG TPA: endonuclease/exonuclease/phosphatase family protein [Propionibacteriaceae bacterium]|jgi:predicted extracellular nuclease|nr:endonuclease/exonuclease/phosphatase family protein [Propionibacteriaceae bacterium]